MCRDYRMADKGPMITGLVTMLACVLLHLLPTFSQAEDWPRWRGPRGNGTWKASHLAEEWPTSGLKRLWKKSLGGGYGGIAVVADRVYVMDRQTQPQEVERVLCLQGKTGDVVWEHSYATAYKKLDYGNGPRSTPTVFEGKVYCIGALGNCCCLDAETGKLKWAKDPQADYQVRLPEWGIAASPLIYQNLVVFHVGAEKGGCLIAFDQQTGAEVWRSGDDPAGYCTPVLIDAGGSTQLILWSPKNVLGFDPQTGREHWRVPYAVTYGVSIATPIFSDGLLFVSGYWEGSKAIRLGPQVADARIAWEENKFLRGLMSQPLVREGLVYSLDKQYGLTCFTLSDGKKLWDDKHQMTPRGRNPQANLVWLDHPGSDRVIVLNSEGELILARISRDGYRESARAKVIDPTWAHPAFADRRVYSRNDTEINCVELPVK